MSRRGSENEHFASLLRMIWSEAGQIKSGSPSRRTGLPYCATILIRAVRREHLHEVGKRVRLKEDLNIFARMQ
jgi:hypothetical protein